MILSQKARAEFDVKPIECPKTEAILAACRDAYAGNPQWAGKDIRTINMAQAVCTEMARLTVLAIGVHIDGGPRAEWLQREIDRNFFRLREWVEYGGAYGTVILKPNGEGIDCLTPEQFRVTAMSDTEITGIVFMDKPQSVDGGKKWYHRLEYHNLESGIWTIKNRCFVSDKEAVLGDPIPIEDTPWAGMLEEVQLDNLDGPLFGVYRAPGANNAEPGSPLSLPVFANALQELEDLDIAYSRFRDEIQDSQKLVLLDSDRLVPDGTAINKTSGAFKHQREQMELPRYIRNVYGDGRENFYQEINPELRTDERLSGINALLGQIGFKCGFSNGYFVYNERTGMVTATQVEADDRRTIQFVKDCRDKLEDALNALIAALDAFADMYDLAPVGDYEVTYDFGDITYNREEDRARWWGYVVSGKVPAWVYFEKFEGIPEEEAKAMVAEASPSTEPFGAEE